MNESAGRTGFVVGLEWDQPGGVQRVTGQLAQEVGRRGGEAFVIALGDHLGEFRETYAGGVCVRRLPRSLATPEGSGFDTLHHSPQRVREVERWCTDHNLDRIHIQHLSAFGLQLPQRLRQLAIPVQWTIHDYHPWCPRGQLWSVGGQACDSIVERSCAVCWAETWPHLGSAQEAAGALQRRGELAAEAIGACDGVFMPSRAAVDVAVACGAEPQSLAVRANDVQAMPWQIERRAFDPGDVRVGVLGSVQPSKGVLQLARWIIELGDPLGLEVHGPREAYHGETQMLAELQRLATANDRVRLMGPYEQCELPLILAGLDLVCVPSLWHEVYGLVAREASLAGVPVFASDRGGLREAAVRLLPAGDGAAWKQALREFASSGEIG